MDIVEWYYQQIESVCNSGREGAIVLADYTEESFRSIRPDEDWHTYLSQRQKLMLKLRGSKYRDRVRHMPIDDAEDFFSWLRINGMENNEASRSTYAALRYQEERRGK